MCQTPYEMLKLQKQGNTYKQKEAQFSDTLKNGPCSGYSGKEEKWLILSDVVHEVVFNPGALF